MDTCFKISIHLEQVQKGSLQYILANYKPHPLSKIHNYPLKKKIHAQVTSLSIFLSVSCPYCQPIDLQPSNYILMLAFYLLIKAIPLWLHHSMHGLLLQISHEYNGDAYRSSEQTYLKEIF
jgi:hypothetical protein